MKKDCLLCGVGGQGTVLASRIIALSEMEEGLNVSTAETIGMAQRGGCVLSHVRISDTEIWSPIIPYGSADIIIAFEPAESVRCLDYLKPDGTVIVNKRAIKPVTASLTKSDYDGVQCLEYLKKHVAHLSIIDGEKVCEIAGSEKVLNIALLAAACDSGALGISVDRLKEAIKVRVPEKFYDMNIKAVDAAVAQRAAKRT